MCNTMQLVTTKKLTEIVEEHLARLGSMYAFTIHRMREPHHKDWNWTVTVGMVHSDNLKEHEEACQAVWKGLRKMYNLVPEDEDTEV